MTTEETLKNYNIFAGTIFSKKIIWKIQNDSFKITTLKYKIKKFILDPSKLSMGKIYTISANNLAHPRQFRTYPVKKFASANCSIWKTARAIFTAPTFFKRIAIDKKKSNQKFFINDGIKYNNSANHILK
jgi:hypothetical protein